MKKHLFIFLTLLVLSMPISTLADGPALTFSLASGFYSDDTMLEIVCSDRNASIYYTLDGSIPDETSSLYTAPMMLTDSNAREDVLMKITGITGRETFVPEVDFPTAHVIRAVAIDQNGTASNVMSGTFFIGYDRKALYGDIPIVLLVTDPEGLFDYETGIYVNGRYHDEWKAMQTAPYQPFQVLGNYSQRGDEWERPVSVTFLFEDGAGFSQEMGMRIKGGATRNHNQKSLRLIAREQYGKKNVKFVLFPDSPSREDGSTINKHKSFTLRSGGNDNEFGKIRDPFIANLSDGLRFETAANRPCLAFINGEYWGLYILNEEYSDNYIQNHYGIDNENVIIVKRNELENGEEGDFDLYKQMFDFITNEDMTLQDNYEKACAMLDMGSFADYCAMNLYIANSDGIFQNNNWQMWRVREPNTNSHPYADGKWRMMAYDMDLSSSHHESGMDNLAKLMADSFKPDRPARLFKSLIRQPHFCRQFVLACSDVRNLYFSQTRTQNMLEQMIAEYHPYRADSLRRFGPSIAQSNPEQYSLDNMKNIGVFFDARYNIFPTFVRQAFSLNAACTVTIGISDPAKGSVYLNGRSVDAPNKSDNLYFPDYPITATAVPAEGSVFVGWKTSNDNTLFSDPNALTTEIYFSDNFTLTAVFD